MIRNRRRLLARVGWMSIGMLATLMILRLLDPAEARPRFVPTQAEAALERQVPSVDLNGIPFDEAITRLGRQWGVEIVGDWRTLKEMGVDRRRPVYLRANQITLADALTEAISQRDHDAPAISYTINDGRILVTSAESLSAVVRVYDVADLCPAPGSPPDAPGTNCFGPAAPDSPSDLIARLIQETVDPDSWRDAGGSIGAVRVLGTKMVIAQSWQNHIAVRSLFAQLREPPAPSTKAPRLARDVRIWDPRVKRWFSPNPADSSELLHAQVGPVSLQKVPLDQAIASLAEKSHAPIYLDRDSLVGLT